MKNIKQFIATLLVLIVAFFLFQPSIKAQGWVQTYDGERLVDVVEDSDGGYLIFDVANPAPDHRIRLMKTDINGQLLWTKILESERTEIPRQVLKNPDNTYLLVGNTTLEEDSTNILLIKLDAEGEPIWRRNYGGYRHDYGNTIVAVPEGGYLLGGITNQMDTLEEAIYLIRIDEDGNEMWSQHYNYTKDVSHSIHNRNQQPITTTSDGGFIFFAHQKRLLEGKDSYLIRINSRGDTLWTYNLNHSLIFGGDFETTEDEGFVFAFCHFIPSTSNSLATSVIKITSSGLPEWEKNYNQKVVFSPGDASLTLRYLNSPAIQGTDDGGFVFTSNTLENDGSITSNRSLHTRLIKINSTGEQLWSKPIGGNGFLNPREAATFIKTTDNHWLIAGNIFDGLEGHSQFNVINTFLTKTDLFGNIYPSYIHGNVFYDLNADCDNQEGEQGLNDWIVKASGDRDFLTTTDSSGNYELNIDTGQYVLSVLPINDLWESCQTDINIAVDNTQDSLEVDFPIIALESCPFLAVDISTFALRRCFAQDYIISYENTGTITAEDAYIEIELDPFLIFNGSSISPSEQTDNLYTFELGDIPIGADGRFTINVTVDCEATLGQTHCTSAHIYPDSLCLPKISFGMALASKYKVDAKEIPSFLLSKM